MKVKFFDAVLAIALFAVVASAFSYNWTPLSPSASSGVPAVSGDGRIICICPSTLPPRISRDWGQTWSAATNAPPGGSFSWQGRLALSADGSQMIACLASNVSTRWIYRSTDFGTNWTKLNVGPSNVDYSVASSADGSKLIAGESHGFVHFSTDSGTNWFTASAPSNNWVSFASSADGRQVVGAANVGRIYVSTNFGADWPMTNFPVQSWNSVCISADGKTIGAIGTSTYIWRSEGGPSLTNNLQGRSIACSANGMTWIIGGAQVYTSSDGGVIWTSNLPPASIYLGAMSADGCEVAIIEAAGSAPVTNWLGHITPAPQLNIQTTNSNANISWLLPSTNFVLQQTADLGGANWENVSSNPTLNFTNLRDEVSVPVTESNVFFRLQAQ